ncbi:hypothetical protein SCUP234_04886 [Seiridium cupressi]
MSQHQYTYAASRPPPLPPRWWMIGAFSSSANPTEDWTKISNLAERRRIQNRIAQRNYFRPTSALTAHSHKSLQQPLRENRRKVLRVAINGQEDVACPDSGSQKNIMVESWAKQNRLRIRRGREDQRIFELGNGNKIRSVGRVRARVRLLAGDPYPQKEWFYVFANCPVPLILGMPFLERNEILTKNRSLLEDCPLAYSQIDSVFWIGSVRNRLRCSLDSHKAIAVADTGSDINLMSLEYAKREGYQIDRRRECRRRPMP